LNPRQNSFLRRYFWRFALIGGLDAWLTANTVLGLGTLPAPLGSLLPLFFVLLGDLRYFMLVEFLTSGPKATSGGTAARMFAWTLAVPLLSSLLMRLLPVSLDTPRTLFLVYELLFLGVVGIWVGILLPRRSRRTTPGTLKVLQRISSFVLAYYALWALADVLILRGTGDFAWGLRTLANALYYGGLLPWVYFQFQTVSRREK